MTTIEWQLMFSGTPSSALAFASRSGSPNQAVPAPRPSRRAAIIIRSVTRPASYASCGGFSSGSTIAIASAPSAAHVMFGRRFASCSSIALSSITMNRHGCVLRELPDQRAISRIWFSASGETRPSSYCRTCRTVRTASSASALLLTSIWTTICPPDDAFR
jgi:hypothetical protein